MPKDHDQINERTTFQTSKAYDDSIDIKSDVVMVYGSNSFLNNSISSVRYFEGYDIKPVTR